MVIKGSLLRSIPIVKRFRAKSKNGPKIDFFLVGG